MPTIRKAVFPVAGLGTRFLPATKASPKEMLTVVDKPLIQYAVEEAIQAGIEEIIFVTSGAKRAIEDHFDTNYELESKLKQKNQAKLLAQVKGILPPHVSCVYTRQAEALGLGHAVLCAKKIVGDEPFAVLLADDLIHADPEPCLSQMVRVFEENKASVLAVQMVKPSETDQYGIVEVDAHYQVQSIVEKPKPDVAPSNLAVVGRYILSPQIFDYLEETTLGAGGEIQLTDAIAKLLRKEPVIAHRFQGVRYDCGSKLGYLKANFDYALMHPELGQECRAYLKAKLS
ncbi:MAG: UTP--glucose-1-phosphate uridylyltransferase [Gammaproteobacteria bacterium]|nr:UTP--glucose-1-phosphate uridylyltransferase [Gammaproteobacteria bacterium]